MGEQEVMHEAPASELADNEVQLSDGRIVVMRETTGADEAAVAGMLGDMSIRGAGATVLVQANAIKSIVTIDGKAPPIMRSYKDYLAVAREFKSKDLMRITKKYAELNMEADASNPLASSTTANDE